MQKNSCTADLETRGSLLALDAILIFITLAARDGRKYIIKYFDTNYKYLLKKCITIQIQNTSLKNVFEIQIRILYFENT